MRNNPPSPEFVAILSIRFELSLNVNAMLPEAQRHETDSLSKCLFAKLPGR
jgi:hypothetical protein